MKNKLLALLVSMAMVIAFIPITAWAEEGDDIDSSIEISITSFETGSLSAAIQNAVSNSNPANITTLKVSGGQLNNTDFYYIRDSLTAIVTLDLSGATCTDNKIPDNAFCVNGNSSKNNDVGRAVTSLRVFTFPQNITSIGEASFRGCSGLVTTTIPDTVAEIGKYAFRACSSWKSDGLTIPSGITVIKDRAFCGCSSLTGTLTISDNVTSIETYAFYNTGFSGKLVLPDSITSLGAQCFENCSNFTDVKFPNNATLTALPANICSGWTSLTKLPEIPENITSFGSGAFKNTSLTSLDVPEHVTDISGAYQNCNLLTEIEIPAWITKIDKAFSGCTGLVEVKIPENVTSYGGAFQGCTSLTKVTIESKSTSIDTNNSLITSTYGTFKNCTNLKEVIVPDSVTRVGGGEFSGCSSLITTDFIQRLTEIGKYAFQGCSSLAGNLTLSATTIGDYAFQNCTSLGPDVTLKKVQSAGSYIFGGCMGLTGNLELGEEASVSSINSNIVDNSNGTENKRSYFSQLTYHGNQSINNNLIRGQKIPYIDLSNSGITSFTLLGSTSCGIKVLDLSGCNSLYSPNLSSQAITVIIDNSTTGSLTNRSNATVLNLNDGSYAYDSTKDISVTVTKDDYTPIWYQDSSYTQGGAETPTKGETNYAKWVSEVTFDANGGQFGGDQTPIAVTEGCAISTVSDEYKLPDNLTRDGYTFGGWNTEADGTGQVVTESTVPTGNTTIYAQWVKKFDGSAESSHTYTVTAIPDQTYTGTKIEPTIVVRNASTGDLIASSEYTVEYPQASTNVGEYTVKVTKDGKTVEETFKIVKDDPIVSLSDVSVTFGDNYELSASAKTTAGNVLDNAKFDITYYTDQDCTEVNKLPNAPSDAGTYYAKATLEGTDNYNSGTTVAKVTISSATPAISITPSSSSLYGGGNVVLTVSGAPTTEGSVVVAAENNSIELINNNNGTWSANLPNATKEYTFTATYNPAESNPNYNSATASCKVNTSYYYWSSDTEEPSTSDPSTDDVLGTTTETVTNEDGVVAEVVTDENGLVTATITVPEGVESSVIEIPAESVNTSTVVRNTETGEVIKLVVVDEGGIKLAVDGDVSIELVDVPNEFADYAADYWAADYIDFAAARGLFTGTSSTTFEPEGAMTRQMAMTVLARLDNVDTTTGATWYEVGTDWAVEQGISNGQNGEDNITREQLVTMLWRYAGQPEASADAMAAFPDASNVSEWAAQAMAWATANNMINGDAGLINPQGDVTRAQVAKILERYVEYVVS